MKCLFFLAACSLFSQNYDAWRGADKLISREQIATKVEEIGREISNMYGENEEIAALILMKGGFCVGADLVRAISQPLTVDFIRTKSYRGTERGSLTVSGLDELSLEGKNVLVIDDIFDSGVSLSTVMEEVKKKNPRSVRSAVAFLKQVDRTIEDLPDFVLFEIPDRFVIGYGMDYNEYGRSLADVIVLQSEDSEAEE